MNTSLEAPPTHKSSKEAPQNEKPGNNVSPKGSAKVKQRRPANDCKITHHSNKYIKLIEDSFGYFVDESGKQHTIKRFTWMNHNCIEAQVITYGARITSLKLPSRQRVVDDVALGFDDIAGYLYHSDLYVGATLGRVTNKVEKGTFVLDNKQYWLSVNNDDIHHLNGGFNGLDKVVWVPNVEGTKVRLSYVSSDLDEGYPGDLFIQLIFELTAKNEFIINMSAITTKPTIVNLSNLLYFNLAGHWTGPDELYKHIVNINANCYTPLQDNGLPSGEIQNVIYTKNDFQIPKLLKEEMGIEPDDGFDEHLCVNRGIDQGLYFMARAVHPATGRVLEMYSNQCGMHFSTVNHFGSGIVDLPVSTTSTMGSQKSPTGSRKTSTDSKRKSDDTDSVFQLLERLHAYVAETLSIDSKTNYAELRDLIRKLHGRKFSYGSSGIPAEIPVSPEGYVLEEQGVPRIVHSQMENLLLNPLQVRYLEGMVDVATKRDSVTNYSEIENIIRQLLDVAIAKDELEMHSKSVSVEVVKNESQLRAEQLQKALEEKKAEEDAELERKGTIRMENRIPSFYKDGRIHGKNDAIYKRHGAMCFQSQNYPNAIYHKNFPSCELRPGETYRHTIVYKFWIQSGDPRKWLKRNFPPTR